MASPATIPAETDVLCEHCGYVLNGLPPGANCPECGNPAADSDPALRTPTAWEEAAAEGSSSASAFLSTSAAVLFRPTRFYRTLATRADTPQATTFGQIYWIGSSLLFSLAAYAHAVWFIFGDVRVRLDAFKWILLAVPTYVFIALMNQLAARLTHWEASYRGLRLTLPVVRRGLYFHAIHYVPVAVLAAATVVAYGYGIQRGLFDPTRTTPYYLYTLSGEVILAAVYLFKTYWTAMRNMMYANA
jgi:hypothetical protein